MALAMDADLEEKVAQWKAAREIKDYETADALRIELREAGFDASGKGKAKGLLPSKGKGNNNKGTDLANVAWEMGMMMGRKGGSPGKDAMKEMFKKMLGSDGRSTRKQQNADNSKTWKSKLWEAYTKTHKTGVTKDTILFTTGEAEGGQYTTTVSSDKFSSTYEGEGDSQKASANVAAEAALRAEFPELVDEFEKEGVGWGGKSENNNAGGSAKQAMMSKMAQWMGGGGQQQQHQQQQSLPARSQLQNAYCKKHKRIAKGDVSYSTEEVEGTNQFVSVVSSENFESSYTGEPGVSKKAAEENAAVEAMQAEFPEEYAGSTAPVSRGQRGAGEKRKREKRERPERERPGRERGGAKGRLNTALRKITKEAVTPGMIEYCTTEEQDMTITTVVIKCLDPEQSFTGDPVDGTEPKHKLEAECSAATVAYEALKDQIDAVEAEQETEQAAKRQKTEDVGDPEDGALV